MGLLLKKCLSILVISLNGKVGKGKVTHEPRRPTWPELIPVQHEATESIVTPPWMGC